jgi:3-dehydroquinate dehydratase-2
MINKVLVMNGPNLNMLGKRPKEHYGAKTLAEINDLIKSEAGDAFMVDFYQSNSEGDLVTKIQDAIGVYDAIVFNPGAYTHTSVAIHDALEIYNGIKIEVHLSKVDEREDFRKINFVRSVCDATFQGKLEGSYIDAIKYLKNIK